MTLNCISKIADLFQFITLDNLQKVRRWWRMGVERAVRGVVLTKTIVRWLN